MLPADALPRASQSRGGATRATATHDGLTAAAVAGAVLTTVAASAPSRRRRPRAPRGLLTVHDLDPPVDEAGEWVPRESFVGSKSFGAFECAPSADGPGCRKRWTSAHAYPTFRQGCQRCETKSLPAFLWHNAERGRRDRDVPQPDDKPHDVSRCEACTAGKCRLGWIQPPDEAAISERPHHEDLRAHAPVAASASAHSIYGGRIWIA